MRGQLVVILANRVIFHDLDYIASHAEINWLLYSCYEALLEVMWRYLRGFKAVGGTGGSPPGLNLRELNSTPKINCRRNSLLAGFLYRSRCGLSTRLVTTPRRPSLELSREQTSPHHYHHQAQWYRLAIARGSADTEDSVATLWWVVNMRQAEIVELLLKKGVAYEYLGLC